MRLKFLTVMIFSSLLASCLAGKSQDDAKLSSSEQSASENSVAKEDMNEEEMQIFAEDMDGENAIVGDAKDIDRVEFIRNYLAAQLSEYEGDRGEAAIFYDMAEKAYPSYMPLKEKAFSMQLLAGNWDDAITLARDLVIEEKPLPLALIALVAEEVKQGKPAEAERYLDRAIKLSPSIVHLKLVKAYLSIALGENIPDVVGNIRDLPYSPLMSAVKHYQLGHMLVMAGDLKQAELEYTMAYEQDAHSLFTVKGLIALLQREGKTEKANEIFERFFKENPDNIMLLESYEKFKAGKMLLSDEPMTTRQAVADVLFNFATLLSSQNASIAGHQMLNMAEALNPEDEAISFYRGILFEQENQIKEAYAAYKNVKENSDVFVAAQVRVAGILQQGEHFDEAIKLMNHVLKNNNLPIFKRITAELYYVAGRYPEAVKAYSDILSEENTVELSAEKQAHVYFARGSSYERMLKHDMAEKDLQKSIDLNPNDASALNYLGYMLVDMNMDIERGMSLISKALLMRPDDASILDSMGWAWYKSGEFSKAAVFLERAVADNPEDPTINMHLGDAYSKLGRISDARMRFERALKIGMESDKDARYIREKLTEMPIE